MSEFKPLIAKAADGRPLSVEEAKRAFDIMMSGEAMVPYFLYVSVSLSVPSSLPSGAAFLRPSSNGCHTQAASTSPLERAPAPGASCATAG